MRYSLHSPFSSNKIWNLWKLLLNGFKIKTKIVKYFSLLPLNFLLAHKCYRRRIKKIRILWCGQIQLIARDPIDIFSLVLYKNSIRSSILKRHTKYTQYTNVWFNVAIEPIFTWKCISSNSHKLIYLLAPFIKRRFIYFIVIDVVSYRYIFWFFSIFSCKCHVFRLSFKSNSLILAKCWLQIAWSCAKILKQR